MRRLLQTDPLPGYEPDIGRWMWALEAVRRRTLASARGLDQAVLDWRGPDGWENSIGSLLYHIALVEMSWLFEDILLEKLPDPVRTEFPHAMAREGRLTHVPLVPLEEHLGRLDRTRGILLEALRGMTLEDWRRVRRPEGVDYQVTPEWAVFHLVEHESGHAAQIRTMRARLERERR